MNILLSAVALFADGDLRKILFLFPADQSVKVQHGCDL